MIIAYVSERPVSHIENTKIGKNGRRISRTAAILLVYLMYILIVVVCLIFLIPALIDNLKELISSFPEIYEKVELFGRDTLNLLSKMKVPKEVLDVIQEEVEKYTISLQEQGAQALAKVITSIGDAASLVIDCLISFLIAFYFIRDRDLIADSVLSFFPRRWRTGIAAVFTDINRIISTFISGQVIVAIIIGLIEMLAMSLVGVKYPVILGIIGGISNIIPMIGPFLGAIPATAFALLDSPIKAIIVVIIFVVIQQFDNNFLTPRIVEGRLGIHPVVTIGVVLAGGILYGICGMIFAVPVTAITVSIFGKIIKAVSKNSLDND